MSKVRLPMGRPMTGAELKSCIEALDLTQAGFAKLIGISHRSVVHWIANEPPGPVETLVRLLVSRPELVAAVREVTGRE